MIYAIQAGESGPIKIGITGRDISRRIAALQIGNPEELKVLAIGDGCRKEEWLLHTILRTSRIRGEWFKPTENVLAVVEAITEGADWYFHHFDDRYGWGTMLGSEVA